MWQCVRKKAHLAVTLFLNTGTGMTAVSDRQISKKAHIASTQR